MNRFTRIWIALVISPVVMAFAQTNDQAAPPPTSPIRYAVIGDSYSCGEGATPQEAWPAVLARHLAASGVAISLVANPARTGWTTEQAINEELPVWSVARPDFATVQIGVNDWVQGVDAGTFQKRLARLLDAMLKILPDKRRLLVVTIPDFSVTPTGAMFGGGRDISRGLMEFNEIIRQEAAKRQLTVVDVFSLSRKMRANPKLTAPDGLHPSAKEYALWEEMIYPVARGMVSGTK